MSAPGLPGIDHRDIRGLECAAVARGDGKPLGGCDRRDVAVGSREAFPGRSGFDGEIRIAARSIDIRIHARPLPVRSDRRRLRRGLQNFIANALRYTPRGRVVLAARRRGDQVALQVWDTGPGIPEHHMRQIYDEFHRYEQPFDWDGRGLGLGLSICQRISRLLGHALDARSAPGLGSMFSIVVPRAQAAAMPHAAAAGLDMQRTLDGLCVLCVDNDSDILAGMDALLSTGQMPSGIPVAAVAVNGAKNAAVLAVRILALADPSLQVRLEQHVCEMAEQVAAKNKALSM